MKRALLAIPCLAVSLSACTLSSKLETYRYAGIDLGTSVTGPLIDRPECYVVSSEIGEFRAIFPLGSQATAQGIQLPSENSGEFLQFGSSYRFNGGFNTKANQRGNSAECPSRTFIVNRIGDPA